MILGGGMLFMSSSLVSMYEMESSGAMVGTRDWYVWWT
jgi:hypothetical protein